MIHLNKTIDIQLLNNIYECDKKKIVKAVTTQHSLQIIQPNLSTLFLFQEFSTVTKF